MSNERDALQFPLSAYLGVIAEIADLYAAYYESPKEFVYLDLLTGLSTLLSGRITADWGSELNLQPRIYGLKISTSAWRRKSSSTRFAKRIIKRAYVLARKIASKDLGASEELEDNNESTPFSVVNAVGSAEGLAEAFGHFIKEHHIEEGENGELHGEEKKFVGSPRILLTFDEFRRLEKKMLVQNSVLGDMLNELYESNEYANRTKGNVIDLDNAHLSLMTNTTTDVYRDMLNGSELKDTGFLNRLFLVYSDERKRKHRPQSIPQDRLDPLLNRLAEMLARLPEPDAYGKVKAIDIKVLPVTPEADELWQSYYDPLEETAENARLDTIGPRLMILMAFAAGKQAIDADVVRAVLELLKYQSAIREALQPNEGATPHAKLENDIVYQLQRLSTKPEYRDGVTESELCRYTNCRRPGRDVLKKALKNLQASQEIQS